MMCESEDNSRRLRELLEECWDAYDRLRGSEFLVQPALPILYFGDIERYALSALRVVTVGLNPSGMEFPDHDRFQRFPTARHFAHGLERRSHDLHLDALNAYFRTDPYDWFACYEPLLRGMGSSYYDGSQCVALHTDLCSPIATSPTWSKLSHQVRSVLEGDGIRIWHSLLAILAPDIVLISIRKGYHSRIAIPKLSELSDLITLTANRKRPYPVRGVWSQISPSKPSLLIFGQAAQTPFGTVSKANKMTIGAAIKDHFHDKKR